MTCYCGATHVCISQSTTYQWNYSRGNFVEFIKYFQQLDWSQIVNNDVEHNWSLLKQHMLTVQELFIPQVPKKPRKNKVPWWSKQVKAAVNKKQKALQRYKATASQADYASYKSCRNKAKDIIRCAILNHESQLIVNMKTKPHCLYSYLRSQKKVKDHIMNHNSGS